MSFQPLLTMPQKEARIKTLKDDLQLVEQLSRHAMTTLEALKKFAAEDNNAIEYLLRQIGNKEKHPWAAGIDKDIWDALFHMIRVVWEATFHAGKFHSPAVSQSLILTMFQLKLKTQSWTRAALLSPPLVRKKSPTTIRIKSSVIHAASLTPTVGFCYISCQAHSRLQSM